MTEGAEPEQKAFIPPNFDVKNHDFHVSVAPKEPSNERTARIRSEDADARHRRWRGTITYLTFVLGVLAIGTACLVLLFRPGTPAQLQQWATVGLSAILSGAVGYLAGKSNR